MAPSPARTGPAAQPTLVEPSGLLGQLMAVSKPLAAGPVRAGEGATHEPLFYAAVMEGERALPGREIKVRLENALARAGL